MSEVADELHQRISSSRESWSRTTMTLCLLGSVLERHGGSEALALDALVFGAL